VTLTTIPIFPVEVELVRRGGSAPDMVRSRQFRSSAARATGKYETRVWRLTFGPEGLAALLAEFDASLGGVLETTWTPPAPDDAAPITVRFIGDGIDVRYGPGTWYEADVELEEVV
jgi:hypothetical protein